MGRSLNRKVSFKHFDVHDDRCAMKVGTDALLLGAWAGEEMSTAAVRQILDVGSGSGIVGLMLAQRFGNAKVHGVEIDTEACQQARENAAACPYSDRITFTTEDALSWLDASDLIFDLIVSNPPFFKNKPKSPFRERNWARHEDTMRIDAWLPRAARRLSRTGLLSLIWPGDRVEDLLVAATDSSLNLVRLSHVKGSPDHEAKRVLAEFTVLPSKSPVAEMITIESGPRKDGQPEYGQRYEEMLRPFIKAF
jgi:tRNA1Val (adenine37-N6)-methyltransferase